MPNPKSVEGDIFPQFVVEEKDVLSGVKVFDTVNRLYIDSENQ